MTNEAWQDDEDDWLDDDEEVTPPPSRRWPLLAALGVAVVFAASAWYALWNAGGMSDQSGAPLIRADSSPVKEKPDDPGGLQIPYQEKLVYERLQPPPAGPSLDKPSQVAPAPEQPVERPEPQQPPQQTATAPAEASSSDPAAANPPAPKIAEAIPSMPAAPPPSVTATPLPDPPAAADKTPAAGDSDKPASSDAAAAPSAADTTTAATQASAAQGASSGAPAPASADTAAGSSATPPTPSVKPAPAAQPEQPAGKASPGTLNDVARVLAGRETLPTTPAKPAPAEASAPAAKTTASATPAAPAPSSASAATAFRIQVAASRDEAGARTAWNRIQSRHTDVLGGLQLVLRRVNIVGKGVFYRVQAGPFAGADAAQSACEKLRAKKQDCLIVRP